MDFYKVSVFDTASVDFYKFYSAQKEQAGRLSHWPVAQFC